MSLTKSTHAHGLYSLQTTYINYSLSITCIVYLATVTTYCSCSKLWNEQKKCDCSALIRDIECIECIKKLLFVAFW